MNQETLGGGMTLELTAEQAGAVLQALRFAIDFREDYFTLAPKLGFPNDYNNGNEKLQKKREQHALFLIDQITR
jgi:hypothetical protein